MRTKKEAFTLVELIVVIVILAILATIAFLSFSSQSSSARDSTRMADISNITKGLGIYKALGGIYVIPDKNISIMSGSTIIGYQGEAGASVLRIIKFSSGGKDPLDGSYYTYTTNASRTKFQILGFLENKNMAINPLNGILDINATTYASRYAYQKGDSLGNLLIQSGSSVTPIQDTTATGVDINSTNSSTTVALNNDVIAFTGTTTSDVYNNFTSTGNTTSGYSFTDDGIISSNSNGSGGAFSAGTTSSTVIKGVGAGAVVSLSSTYSGTGFTRVSGWDTPSTGNSSTLPELGDLDGDGDLDLLQGNGAGTVLAYENTGNASAPIWTRKASWDGPSQPRCTQPKLVDMDSDGDLDLYVGFNAFSCGTDDTSRPQTAYENSGTRSNPTWTRKSSWDAPNLTNGGFGFGDLDGDGLKDFYYSWAHATGVYGMKNIGTLTAPAWTGAVSSNWHMEAGTDIGSRTTSVAFADLDKDGDLDMLRDMGFYKNMGTPTSPRFATPAEVTAGTHVLSGFSLAYACGSGQGCPANATFGDLDGDGNIDAISGGVLGTTGWTYRNTAIYGYPSTGTFTSSSINIGVPAKFKSFSWNDTLNGQTITIKARSSATSDFSSATAWASCSNITKGADPKTGGCVNDGHQYIQYQATLSTGNSALSPTLDNVIISFTK